MAPQASQRGAPGDAGTGQGGWDYSSYGRLDYLRIAQGKNTNRASILSQYQLVFPGNLGRYEAVNPGTIYKS